MTRNEWVLKHLQQGLSITNTLAFERYNITSLQEAIRDLRACGHVILTQMHTSKNGKRYGRYTLVADDE